MQSLPGGRAVNRVEAKGESRRRESEVQSRKPVIDRFALVAGEGQGNACACAGGFVGGADDFEDATAVIAARTELRPPIDDIGEVLQLLRKAELPGLFVHRVLPARTRARIERRLGFGR